MDSPKEEGVRSLFSVNDKAAEAFAEIAEYMELKGENPFKIKAYVKAAQALRTLDEDLASLVREDRVQKVPGIGKSVAQKLTLLLETGRIPQLEALRREVPAGLLQVARLPGLGAKKTAQLHRELGVTNLSDLQEALGEGRVAELKGFSKKSEQKLLLAVEEALSSVPTFIKKRLEQWGRQACERFSELPGVLSVQSVGGVRRREPEGTHLPLLVVAQDPVQTRRTVQDQLEEEGLDCRVEEGAVITTHPSGCPLHLFFCAPDQSGTELVRRTGPEEFVRKLAESAPLPQADSEESLFEQAQRDFIAPELRHRGETSMPELLELSQIQGNLHGHSTYSDGRNTLAEMMTAAVALGHRYYGVTDHSRSLVIANGLTLDRLEEQQRELDGLREQFPNLVIFAGSECDILEDGSRDYPDDVLDGLDFVVAAVHSFFHLDAVKMTDRILAGLDHARVKVLAHPTGRLLTRRAGYDADWDQIFEFCAERRIALEVNASPWRLDLSEELLERALAKGCLISINTDAHATDELENMVHGVDMARRAAVPADRVVNTWSAEELREWFGA